MIRKLSGPALIFLALLAFFLPMSSARLVAGDEGFYVMAAKLISEGNSLYTDFFYPQMPLLPKIFALWMKTTSPTWESSRLLCGILSSLIGVLLFIKLRSTYTTIVAICGTLLFATSTLTFAWLTTVKTFNFSILFLFIAYLLTSTQLKIRSHHKYLLAGVFLGLAIDVRLFFAGLAPVFAIYILTDHGSAELKSRFNSLLFFCVGIFLALLPSIYLFLMNFDVFYFNNLGYHLLRDNKGPELAMRAKMTIFKSVIGFRETKQFSGIQLPLFFWLTILGMLLSYRSKIKIDLAVWIAIALFCINFLPTPTYIQYFCTLIPFLIIGTFQALYRIADLTRLDRNKAVQVIATLGIAYLLWLHGKATVRDIDHYTRTGYGVIGVGAGEAPNKTLNALNEISDLINSHIDSGDIVLSEWPGFLVNTKARVYPGLENHFGWGVAGKLNEEQRSKYKIIDRAAVRRRIQTGDAPYVLLERKSYNRNYQRDLTQYDLIAEVRGAMFFKLKEG